MSTTGALRRVSALGSTVTKRAAAPLISQGINAGGSLLLQILAARTLGLAAYGSFAVCLALLSAATALYTGYVGDSLAVLDRHDRDTRATLVASAITLFTLAFVVAFCTVEALLHSPAAALVYAVMTVLWLFEETFRRILIARLEFWKLVANDSSYNTIALVIVGVMLVTGHRVTLGWIFAAMAAGAATAVAIGIVQVPRAERTNLRPGWAAMRAVATFAAWRSLHAALRPTALLLSKALVISLISLTASGVLESGRLVVAPLQVIINGAGSFLLAGFAAGERGKAARNNRMARYAVWLLLATTVICGSVLALFAGPAGRIMTGHPVAPLLVFGWTAYLAVWAVGLPYISEVVARKHSRTVFIARLIDSVLGLGLAAIAIKLSDSVTVVPWLMALGGLYAVWRVVRLAIRTRNPEPAT
ncbi:MAG TPA: oligosaccharide flippase family protein [Pseudonocardiaceae bacterium]|nr:oligosaccharide flippase family protein [Pseudonocardiaceae bacterium]